MLRIRVCVIVLSVASLVGFLHCTAASAAIADAFDLPEPAAEAGADPTAVDAGGAVVWMQWDANQYALADDGASIWIGGGQGLVRWEKAAGTYRRYSVLDGLPSHTIHAIAVDASGNRWFGGDGGLSRLDPAEAWTHFTPANSGIFTATVTGIATAADGTIWLGYAPPQTGISRRDPDGSWHFLPDRTSAVASNYARIITGGNVNPLWTVAGAEVWVDYYVYNGLGWSDRTPDPPRSAPRQLVAAPDGSVWALEPDSRIWEWDGSAWEVHTVQFKWSGSITAIAPDASSRLWLGIRSRDSGATPYGNEQPELRILDAPAGEQLIAGNVPVAALLAEGTGVWAAGPGWLNAPDGTLQQLVDTPAYPDFERALLDQAGAVWLQTSIAAPYAIGTMQRLNDAHTAVLDDDRWTRFGDPYLTQATALDRAPGGDVWMAYVTATRFGPFLPDQPVGRYHQNTWHSYHLPDILGIVRIDDIFALDDRRTWFTYTRYRDSVASGGVLALDDGGTLDDVSDDRWTEYPEAGIGAGGAVTADSQGQVWYGSVQGIVRWNGTAWQKIWADGSICDLTPARDGIVFALIGSPLTCLPTHGTALKVHPDNRIEHFSVEALVSSQLALVRTAARPNRLWSVAREGAVWYLDGSSLYRRDDSGLVRYALPHEVTWMEAGPEEHVWLRMDDALWRLSRRPELTVTPAPMHWLMTPGGHYAGSVVVDGIEGYSAPAALALHDLPAGVTATWTTAVVTPTQSVPLTLTASAGAGLGSYPFTLHYASGVISSTVVMTAVVADTIRAQILPEIHR